MTPAIVNPYEIEDREESRREVEAYRRNPLDASLRRLQARGAHDPFRRRVR